VADNDGPRETIQPLHQRKRKHEYRCHKPMIPRQPKFEGECDDLKGHIYDYSDVRQSDIFMKTTKEIGEFFRRTYKYGGNIRLVVENLELPVMDKPSDPPENATRTQERIWEKQVDEFVKRSITILAQQSF
jgi:hypothetical protein